MNDFVRIMLFYEGIYLRLRNIEELIVFNRRIDVKIFNGVSYGYYISNDLFSVYLLRYNFEYFNLKYVVENKEFYFFIFSNV